MFADTGGVIMSKDAAMSLWSLLNTGSTGTTATFGTARASTEIQSLIDSRAAASSAKSASAADGGASISSAAHLAAQEKADNKKDFAALSAEVRATLNAAYTRQGNKAVPVLDQFSGRALAAIMLNRDGSFSRREIQAARTELRSRQIHDYTSALSGQPSLAALKAYNAQILSRYDAISAEEREALRWTGQTRSAAQHFIQSASTASTAQD